MKHLYIITVFLLCCVYVKAQEQTRNEHTITISGTVFDEFDAPIPGANVFLKDRPGVGTVTNMDGKFTIKGAQRGDIITISFLGYEKQEVRIDARLDSRNAQIKLKPTTNTLDETVVVGLGSQRKVSVVGAITNVDVKDLQTPATSLPNMLGGRVPGIISLQNSGEPGKNISEFWIRGIGTFGANQGALVLIDGLEGSLSQIDPADIESFSVLKDASATAVYGTRGANGVVLVTTKRGEVDKLRITGRVNMTVSHLQNMPEYLGAYDYALLANEAKLARGEEALYSPMALDLIKYQLDPDLYPNVNWRDEILNKNSLQQTYYMSARGGGSVARYFFSLGMSNEAAAYKQEKSSKYSTDVAYRTYNYRSNIDVNLTKTTTAYLGTEGYLSEKTEPGNVSTDALWIAQRTLTPLTIPLQYSTGELPAWGANNEYSPYVMLNHTGKAKWRRFTNKVTLAVTQDLPFITKGLKLRAQIAYDSESYFKEVRKVLPEMYYASGRTVDGTLIMRKVVDAQTASYSNEESQWYKLHFESTLNYDRAFGDHRVGGLVYYYMSSYQNTWCDVHGFDCKDGMHNIPKRYQGLSGRVTYGFRDTYLIDLNFGYTGSENFQKGRRFGFFPSVAIGWIPTNYEFVREKLPWLNFLKFRGSWGTVGNDRITNKRFPYLTIMNENSNKGWNGNSGITEQSVGADNLQWERATKIDLGIEGKLFDERVDFTVDFFRDTRNDIFQQRTMVPDYVGLPEQPFGNVGSMISYGADGNISFTQNIGKDISFTIRGNFTYTANMVKKWEETLQKYAYQERANKPYNYYSGYIALGLFRDENDVKFSPDQTGIAGRKLLPGDIKYKDVNGDGVISSEDQVPLSYNANYPRLMYGFGGEFRWKKITLGVLFKGTGNVDNYSVDWWKSGSGFLPFATGETGNTLTIAAHQANRWTPREISGDASTENPNAMFPRLSFGNDGNSVQASTFWKNNARYLRLQEINLNYNLSAGKILKSLGVTSLDLQFVASNICVWSPFKLWDPEQAAYNGTAYPIPARYAFQMYINF